MSVKNRFLLVEGREDQQLIFQFCNHFNIDNRNLFQVLDKVGYPSLRDDLRVRAKTGAEVVGAIVDADTDQTSRWQSISDALRKAGYANVPADPVVGGLILEGTCELARVGVWMMPDNEVVGGLEDFVKILVPEGDDLIGYADSCVDGIDEQRRRYKEEYRSKAVIHTWLAWQEEPGTAMGLAITKRYLDPNHPLSLSLRDWICGLFQ
jgi:hypothetical protein